MVFGLKTVSETDMAYDKAAGLVYKVYDDEKDTKMPVRIRIQVLGTQDVKLAEDIGTCSANQFSEILNGASATDEADGDVIEYRQHIPKNIYLYAANAYRVVVVRRFADEN
jgi:hypothetical protein